MGFSTGNEDIELYKSPSIFASKWFHEILERIIIMGEVTQNKFVKKLLIGIVLILFVALMCLASACSQNKFVDQVIFKEVDISSTSDRNLSESLIHIVEDGVYQIAEEEKSYIIFNGIENTYEDFSYKENDNIIDIIFSKVELHKKNQIVYELILPEKIDTIRLLQDGEESTFKSVII